MCIRDSARLYQSFGRGCRINSRHRQCDEAWLRLSDGSVYTRRFCGSRHYLLHRRDHVQRVSREAICSATSLEENGAGRFVWTKEWTRLLRLYKRSEESDSNDSV